MKSLGDGLFDMEVAIRNARTSRLASSPVPVSAALIGAVWLSSHVPVSFRSAVLALLAAMLVHSSQSLAGPQVPESGPVSLGGGIGRNAISALNPDLCSAPDRIVYGAVTGKQSYFVRDGAGKKIISDVEFFVERVIAGQTPTMITIIVPGGEVGDVGMFASGAPRMVLGSHYLLFLRMRDDSPSPAIVAFQFIPRDVPFLIPPDEFLAPIDRRDRST